MHCREASFLLDFRSTRSNIQRKIRIGNVLRNTSDRMHMTASIALMFPGTERSENGILARCILTKKSAGDYGYAIPVWWHVSQSDARHTNRKSQDCLIRKRRRMWDTPALSVSWEGDAGKRNERNKKKVRRVEEVAMITEHCTTILWYSGRREDEKEGKTGSCLVIPFSRSERKKLQEERERYEKTTRGIRWNCQSRKECEDPQIPWRLCHTQNRTVFSWTERDFKQLLLTLLDLKFEKKTSRHPQLLSFIHLSFPSTVSYLSFLFLSSRTTESPSDVTV